MVWKTSGELERLSQDIGRAFKWSTTEEGATFWCKAYDSVLKASKALKVKEVEAKQEAERIKNLEELTSTMSEDDTRNIIKILGASFLWSRTPQGAEYWEKVVENLQDLLDKHRESQE